MKKIVILLAFILWTGNLSVMAQSEDFDEIPSKYRTTVNRIKVKHYAKKFVRAKVLKKNEKAGEALKKVFECGATNTNISLYRPCPCRKNLEINGKTVNAEGKFCVVLKYQYNEKNYETGKCKKINK